MRKHLLHALIISFAFLLFPSCTGQNTIGLNSQQLSKNTHRGLEGSTINQGNILKADLDEFIKELRNCYDKVNELKRQQAILEKHSDYSSMISKIEKAGPLILVDPSREKSLYDEIVQTSSEEEIKVLRKMIELDEEASALPDNLDEQHSQLLERCNSLSARRLGDIMKGVSDEENAQLTSLSIEIDSRWNTILAIWNQD